MPAPAAADPRAEFDRLLARAHRAGLLRYRNDEAGIAVLEIPAASLQPAPHGPPDLPQADRREGRPGGEGQGQGPL